MLHVIFRVMLKVAREFILVLILSFLQILLLFLLGRLLVLACVLLRESDLGAVGVLGYLSSFLHFSYIYLYLHELFDHVIAAILSYLIMELARKDYTIVVFHV